MKKIKKDYLLLVFVKPTPFTISCYVEILLKKQKSSKHFKEISKEQKKMIKQHECEKKKNLLQVSVQNEIR